MRERAGTLETRDVARQQGGENYGRYQQKRGPVQSEDEQQRGDYDRTDRKPQVPAGRKPAHSRRAARTAEIVGKARRFGVKSGDPDPRYERAGEHQRHRRREPNPGRARGREQQRRRNHPRQRSPVRQVPE